MTTIETAKALFAASIANGLDEEAAAQAVWLALRPSTARAPRWDEALARNGSGSRSYKSPLGSLLGLTPDAYGQHAANWPRTVSSTGERDCYRALVLEALR